jgi:hypothetical protein
VSRFVSLAAERLESLAGHSAEAGRLARGRALFRKGAVGELVVTDGLVTARVQGSQTDGYETTVATTAASRGVIREVSQGYDRADSASMDRLIADGVTVCPRAVDVAYSCSCPDWEEPCKHAVATLLAFAERVDLDDDQLLLWRGITHPANGEVSLGSAPVGPLDDSANGTANGSPAEPADPAQARRSQLGHLRRLLGDTAPNRAGRSVPADPPPAPLDPAMADFLGHDATIEPVDFDPSPAPTPLFTGTLPGPLADLGPELADAIEVIARQLDPR